MLKGVILTNPYDDNPAQTKKVARMLEEFTKLGVAVEVKKNDAFVARIVDGNAECFVDADFVLYFEKDKYVAELLEKCGIRVFNSAAATAICDDKMLSHIVLCNHGIPMPATLPGALCYNEKGEVTDEYLQNAIDTLGLPMVVKQCHGSFGEQVYLASTFDELKHIVKKIKMSAYLFQQYEFQSSGRDMRVIVIGGRVVCGMMRENLDDFRSNVAHGGKAKAIDVPKDIAKMCEKTANIIGLDYCGVDVLLGDTPKLCEVNSNAMFEAMEAATGVNVAKLYAEHIIKSVKNDK
ncbi:MAG: RimK family alpha-L-glutamate ligase [Clostridiales bacterium]|nr:RimK family alpha-L-glutamate ligase [Clostridiales bacterium]